MISKSDREFVERIVRRPQGSVPQTPSDFPMWRIVCPTNPRLYYSHRDTRFVDTGYSTWTNTERFAKFPNPDPERIWESFGYYIPLYDPGEEL